MAAGPGGVRPGTARAGGSTPSLVDIDHSPSHLLHPSHAGFYTADGLRRLAAHLHPGGVFALWSNDPPDADFIAVLARSSPPRRAHVVTFANPLQRRRVGQHRLRRPPATVADRPPIVTGCRV